MVKVFKKFLEESLMVDGDGEEEEKASYLREPDLKKKSSSFWEKLFGGSSSTKVDEKLVE